MKKSKILFRFLCAIIIVFSITACAKPLKPTEATFKEGSGKLISSDELIFSYMHFPVSQKGATIIYVAGLGGKTGEAYALASELNEAGMNFIGFDRAEYDCSNTRSCLNNVLKRSTNGNLMYPSTDGKYSATDNIIHNEIDTILQFAERSPMYDSKKGIYLIGGSYGSWLSLVAVHSYPNKNIKGVVFLSPAILPEWAIYNPQTKITLDKAVYFKNLVKSFGQRPALAIGSKNDIIDPHESKDGSTIDGAKILSQEIGSNVEILEVTSALHSNKLISGSKEVRDKIIKWLIFHTK